MDNHFCPTCGKRQFCILETFVCPDCESEQILDLRWYEKLKREMET